MNFWKLAEFRVIQVLFSFNSSFRFEYFSWSSLRINLDHEPKSREATKKSSPSFSRNKKFGLLFIEKQMFLKFNLSKAQNLNKTIVKF